MDSISPSPSSHTGNVAASSIASSRRTHFDDRSQTNVSVQLRAHRAQNGHQIDGFGSIYSHMQNAGNPSNIINWSETSQICKVLNTTRFGARFGSPTVLELTPTHILVGTNLGRVAAFDYHQNLDILLDLGEVKTANENVQDLNPSAVTCVAVSSDGLYICAGHADGSLVVWEIPREVAKKQTPTIVPPYDIIKSVSLHERAASSEISGHLYGVPVNSVTFVGDSHHNLVSSDISGLVLFHHGFQKLFRKKFVSQRLLGHHVATSEDISDRFSVTDCQMLPIGTAPHLSDHLGVLAVITSNLLVVISVCSLNNETTAYPKTHFKATRPKNVYLTSDHTPVGCLRWYPSIKSKDGVSKNAKLAYSWNNVLTILELDNSQIPENAMAILADLKDKDRAIPNLEMVKTARWLSPKKDQKVVALQWLNSEILTALVLDPQSGETKLHFLYYKTDLDEFSLELVGLDNIDSQRVSCMSFPKTMEGLESRFYTSSFRIFRHKPVILVDSHSECSKSLVTGSTSKWADRLMALITAKDFLAALLCAYDYYSSQNVGQLLLTGLPHTSKERHLMVEPFLLDIMRESIASIFIFDGVQAPLKLEEGLWLYFYLTSIITSDHGGITSSELLDILDAVHEMVNNDRHIFFKVLEQFLLAGKIHTLSPIIFKSLVETYVEAGNGARLTEIICLLDTTTLNIDLTLKLCETHGLRECLVYIWTALLKDYSRPLLMLLADLDGSQYEEGEKNLVYTYMSYILSGRQFPTDEFMSLEEEQTARGGICKVIFSLREINNEMTREFDIRLQLSSVFPYLFKLLQFNTFETLATLNEFFENPCLNTEEKGELNRQYVIEALLDIFAENIGTFSTQDRVYLAIFLARNYPKYFQFIRLSESVLEETVELLCSSPKECHSDSELALESLLAVYDVKNESLFQERIKAAKFYRVAFGLNRSMQKFSSALEIWLEQQIDDDTKDIHRNFTAFSDIVANTFKHQAVNATEKTRLIHMIEDHFEELIAKYMQDMVMLANSYNASMHNMVLKCGNEKLAYEYLRLLFEETETPDFGQRKVCLVVRYIGLSCLFARDQVCNIVDIFSTELLQSPSELEELKQRLRDEKCFDALAILSRNGKCYHQAIEELSEGLNSMIRKKKWTGIDNMITIGVSICEKDQDCWRHLIHTLVSLPKPNDSNSTSFSDSVNQGIYRCFREIIDKGEKEHHQGFFTEILQGVMEEATVSHVREVLQETLTSFYFDSEIHNITLQKLNTRIRKHMEYVKIDRLSGWVLKDKMCSSCGKAMWGDEMAERHRAAWESREKARVFLGHFDKQEFKDCELAFFKCGHGYHSQCLERLGSEGKCVICTQ